jgi:hypothetical protein
MTGFVCWSVKILNCYKPITGLSINTWPMAKDSVWKMEKKDSRAETGTLN